MGFGHGGYRGGAPPGTCDVPDGRHDPTIALRATGGTGRDLHAFVLCVPRRRSAGRCRPRRSWPSCRPALPADSAQRPRSSGRRCGSSGSRKILPTIHGRRGALTQDSPQAWKDRLERIHLLLVDVPRMLRDIVDELVGDTSDVDIAGRRCRAPARPTPCVGTQRELRDQRSRRRAARVVSCSRRGRASKS